MYIFGLVRAYGDSGAAAAAAFNLQGGPGEFDFDVSCANAGVISNSYTVSSDDHCGRCAAEAHALVSALRPLVCTGTPSPSLHRAFGMTSGCSWIKKYIENARYSWWPLGATAVGAQQRSSGAACEPAPCTATGPLRRAGNSWTSASSSTCLYKCL